MTLLGSVDIPFTKSTKIAVDATDTAGQAATVAQQATDTAGQAQATAQTASQTATQAAATAAGAAQAAQTAITTANGKNKAYYGATTTISPQPGDIWFVDDGSNNVTAIKHYDGAQWVTDVDNTALAQQISAAQAAADNAVTVGQAAQQTAADAEAKGDAAANAAEEAKDAATQAQADAASAVTIANNAVSTANQATQDAQDAIDKSQDSFDVAQNALSVANSAASTASDAEQVANDAATQSSNAWTKAQDAMAEAQKKADATSVYTKTDIDNTLSGYATTTTVNTLTGRVDSAETAIQQNTEAITLKADQSTVNTLTGRISTAEATLETQANEIAARITKTDADAKYATQTALTATSSTLTSQISKVQTNLDGLEIGGRNLLDNSDFKQGMPSFINPYQSSIQIVDDSTYGKCLKVTVTGTGITGLNSGTYLNDLGTMIDGEHYSYQAMIRADTDCTVWMGYQGSGTNKCTAFSVSTSWIRIKKENELDLSDNRSLRFYAESGTVFYITRVKFEQGNKATDWSPAPEDMATVAQFNTLSQTLDSTVSRIGNAEGNISALQQTSDSFATRISNAEGNITTLTQTTDGLQTTVSGKVDTTTYDSFVTQTNTALQSKLSAQDAASTYATQSQLTQTTSSLQSSIDQIKLSGSNLVIDPSWEINGNTSEKYHSGSKSLKVIANGYIQDIPLMTVTTSGGRMFYAEVWVLADQSSWDGVVGLQVSEYNSSENSWSWPIIQDLPANGGQTWTKLSGYVTVPDGYDKIAIRLSVRDSVTNGAVFYFDDAFVTEVSGVQSQISQLADDINLRVQKGDVINQINVSTEGILIDGQKIHITGQTTIDNAVIKDAMIQSLSATKVSATSLSAISANLGSVNAGNITGVNITGSDINIGSGKFHVDTAGNLTATSATISGTISTAGLSGGTLSGTTITQSASNTDGGGTEKNVINNSIVTTYSGSDFGDGTYTVLNWHQYSSANGGLTLSTDYNLSIGGENVGAASGTLGVGTIYAYKTINCGNITINGYHTIVSADDGDLYFSNGGDGAANRINIHAQGVYADYWLYANNMQIGYHHFYSNDGGDVLFTDSSGAYSYACHAKAWTVASKAEWKQQFEKVDTAQMLSIANSADVMHFRYNSDVAAGKDDVYTGFVIGGGYNTPDDFTNFDKDGIDTYKVCGVLTGAVQELTKRNQQLVTQIGQLEDRISKLEESAA